MKNKLFKGIACALAVAVIPVYSFAGANLESVEHIDIKNGTGLTAAQNNGIKYIASVMGKNNVEGMLDKYTDGQLESKDVEHITQIANMTQRESEVNGFSKAQAKQLLKASLDLEMGKARCSEMVYSEKIPEFAPSHDEDVESKMQDLNSIAEPFSASDRSSRTKTDKTGVGYEVKSKPGYKETTSFLTLGSCNVKAAQGRAGYMFNTVYHNGHYQDLGLCYCGSKWKAFVSGYWTGWATGKISAKAGDKLYLRTWIGDDKKIHMLILDGNDFSRIIFQNSYSTSNQIAPDGKGVEFNRQITLVDDKHDANSNLYLKNASFSDAYLYSTKVTEKFNSKNTDSSRRGKFGCTWASDKVVTILSNTRWSDENITIIMKK